jgi:phospholipid N-methyltransferase
MLLLNHLASISRRAAVGANGRQMMQQIYSGVPCLVLPMGSNATIQNEMQMGRAYEAHFGPDADVRVGDRIVWNGTILSVKYVRDYRNTPPVSHFEAVCEQEID